MVEEKTPIKIRIIKSPSMFSINMEGLFYYEKNKLSRNTHFYFANNADGIKTVTFLVYGKLSII